MAAWGRGRQELLFVIYLFKKTYAWLLLYVPVQRSEDLPRPQSPNDNDNVLEIFDLRRRPDGFSCCTSPRPRM